MFQRTLFTQRKYRRETPGMAMAPMVDVLTILLVFLLKSFSMDPPVRPNDNTFTLARSTSSAQVQAATDVDITPAGIYVNGWRVASTSYYSTHDDALIQELYERLQQAGGGDVNLRVDASIPYGLVRKAIFSLRTAGVERLSMVAQARESL